MAMAFNDMTRSLRNQAERLNASYRRFATVTQSARDAIISTDARRQHHVLEPQRAKRRSAIPKAKCWEGRSRS